MSRRLSGALFATAKQSVFSVLSRSNTTAKQSVFSVLSRSNTTALIHNSSFFLLRIRPIVAYGRLSPTRGFATGQTEKDPDPNGSNQYPQEPTTLEGCASKHWLIVVEKPEGDPTRDEIVDNYVKTLAMVVGSEEEARMKIYSVSTRCYFEFGALVTDEVADKITELPNVQWVVPDSYSYLYVRNNVYGGESFINGQAVPYDPKYHEALVWNNEIAYERNRRNDRPRPGSNMGAQPNPPTNDPLGASNMGAQQSYAQNNSGTYPLSGPPNIAPNYEYGPNPNNGGAPSPYQPGPGLNHNQRGFAPAVGPNQGQNQNAYANVPSSGVGYPPYQNKNVTGRYMTPLPNPSPRQELRAMCSVADEFSDEKAIMDFISYSELINHLCRPNNWREVKIELRELGFLGLFPDASTCSYILEYFLAEDLVEEAEDLFSIMLLKRPQVLTSKMFNSLMAGYCLQGRMSEAKSIFRKYMKNVHIVPDMYTAIIASALMDPEEFKTFADKFQAFTEVHRPVFYEYCHFLGRLFRKKLAEQALLLLAELEHRGENVDIAYYNIVLEELCKLKNRKRALQVFYGIKAFDDIKGIKPNTATYNAMIRGLCQYQCLKQAKRLFAMMIIEGVRPDGGIFNAIVQDNLRKAQYAEAAKFIEEMGKQGFSPNQFTFELLILLSYRRNSNPQEEVLLQTCMKLTVALRQKFAY